MPPALFLDGNENARICSQPLGPEADSQQNSWFCEDETMRKFDRITWNPNQMNGQPCIRGLRLTVRRVVEAVAIYPHREDLFRNYPELEPDDVQQALEFAAANLEDRAATTPAA
mgnify:FL=1